MEIYRGANSLAGLLELGLERFRSLAANDVRRRLKIRGHDPGAKSPHINPVQTVLSREYFSPSLPVCLSLFAAEPRNARARVIFYFKNERGGEGYSATEIRAEGDTLLIKTIDLSPGLRMHLEINTRGRAHARTHLPRGWKRAFPDDHLAHPARYLTLMHLRYSPSVKIPDFLTVEESEFGALK